jgi:hypothetical protein
VKSYHLFTVTHSAYTPHLSFKAATPQEAARRHVNEWDKRPTAYALVMLNEDGVWHSLEDSRGLIAA